MELGFPKLDAWVKRCEKREGTKKALEGDMISAMVAKANWKETAAVRSEWVWDEGEKKQ